jgi:hypothetical protein
MEILSPPEVSTEQWTAKVPQYELPDYRGEAPDAFTRRGKAWSQDFALRPWFDQENALEKVDALVANGAISADEETLLRQWVIDGYFVLPHAVEPAQFDLIDEYVHDLDEVWMTDRVMDGLQISGVYIDGVKRGPIHHAEVLKWPVDVRLRLRDQQTWRIHYYHPYSPAGVGLAKTPRILRLTHLLLNNDPVLLNLTTYKYSSEVALHQDLWFYHLHPANHIVGIWFACEDVHPDTGPLAVYPGSQKVPMWPGFPNYPQTSYRTCHPSAHVGVENYLAEHVKGVERVVLPIKRGDAIFLNGLLVHDADKVKQRGARSRFSIVFHYTIPGANKAGEVEGPFNY